MQEIKSMFTVSKGDMKHIVRAMNKDMNRGLKKEGVSSMHMIPSYITHYPTGKIPLLILKSFEFANSEKNKKINRQGGRRLLGSSFRKRNRSADVPG